MHHPWTGPARLLLSLLLSISPSSLSSKLKQTYTISPLSPSYSPSRPSSLRRPRRGPVSGLPRIQRVNEGLRQAQPGNEQVDRRCVRGEGGERQESQVRLPVCAAWRAAEGPDGRPQASLTWLNSLTLTHTLPPRPPSPGWFPFPGRQERTRSASPSRAARVGIR